MKSKFYFFSVSCAIRNSSTVYMDEIYNVLDYGFINYRLNGKRLCHDAYCYTMGLDGGDK